MLGQNLKPKNDVVFPIQMYMIERWNLYPLKGQMVTLQQMSIWRGLTNQVKEDETLPSKKIAGNRKNWTKSVESIDLNFSSLGSNLPFFFNQESLNDTI